MGNKTTVTFDLPEKVYKEFEAIARQVGHKKAEDLLVTYIREVVISARLENATAKLREIVVRGSNDLDDLIIKPSKPKS